MDVIPGRPPDRPSAADRVRDLLAGLGCTRAELAALAILAAGAVTVLLLLWVLARPAPAGVGPDDAGGFELAEDRSEAGVVVHVSGEVAAPGLYRLQDGARVADALEDAGGPTQEAVLDAVNLARPLRDGEQLVVPGPAPAAGSGATTAPAPSARRPDGTLDLNRATAADLQELPGIGPVLAERIIEHRDRAGGFTAVEDLRGVPGIGDRKYAAIADLVTV